MNQHKCTDCIIKSAAAKNLDSKEFEVLENNSARVTFKKGEIIFKQDALSLNIAYLREGLVKIHMKGPSHEKILRVMKAPSFLGIPTSMGEKINQFSATALEDTTVCFIDSNVFKNFIYTNGKFAYEVILELCRNELFDYQRYASLAQKQVPGLVAETLICFSDKIYGKDHFNIPLSRSDMADLIGTSRESVSRVFSDFNNEKIIEIDSNEVTILNKDLLIQISEKG
jgi:CRP-like cAMP-binding protein